MNRGAPTHAAGVRSPPSPRAVSSNTGNPTTASLALPTLALRHRIYRAWHALRADHACCTPALDGYGFQRIQN
ncbi:hypothetical protein [Comamonas jiangduensis]|uniref:hypothetical protein n=1 Tax=Comamonas jiangduensis TaxID=1194168 RepID=UPI003BF839CC